MPVDHREKGFETAIESYLLTHGGYVKRDSEDFDKEYALDTTTFLSFLENSQPVQYLKLKDIHGEDVKKRILDRLVKELDTHEMLDVIRNGFTDHGVAIKVAFFAPASKLNPESAELYQKNIFTITRQVHFSKTDEKSLDLVLSINGLPVATAEIKNPLTGQNFEHAKKQYMHDRDPNELLFQFKKRALVHFAVDTDEVYMTTKLAGPFTSFLPFNQGDNNGAGNPVNPTGYKTSYLWEKIWQKDSWLDIFARFVQIEVKKIKEGHREIIKESIIFPRFHQLDAVRKIEADAKRNGAGENYLIQHSAGSGKSNTIAWTAHRLSNLHDEHDQSVFDSIVVITDRVVLDQQLQDTIFQFDHKQGVVEKIDENSSQLADALIAGKKIIVTTVQKFPFVLEKIGQLPSRKYAVIIDEAHSSQTGETAKAVKQALGVMTLEEAEKIEVEKEGRQTDSEDEIVKSMQARGRQKNISFFAFTATPKYKTLEIFGRPGSNGKPVPFHLYSMRQAIEEGFIMDVLQNYTTYATYFRVAQKAEAEKKVDRKRANVAITNFVHLHEHNIAEKARIIVEHFRNYSMSKIGGQAKAMVVTRSRLHAVKYRQGIDKYLHDNNYDCIKTVVAFSGTVIDENGEEYTESGMNGFGEKQLPEKFSSRDYQMLIVADKYQTGYDQPLLHSMYVDKRLSGLRAVQTLARLNRTHPGKEDTFILDFANNPAEIQKSFQQYYEDASILEKTDPNMLYDLQIKLQGFRIFLDSEVEEFCTIFFKRSPDPQRDQGLMNAILDRAVTRFKSENPARQEGFKSLIVNYLRQYSFLSQLISFQDLQLEKLYAYCRFLLKKLPHTHSAKISLTGDVALEYYRLEKVREGNLSLQKGVRDPLKGPTELGTGRPPEELASLEEVIKAINKRFGNIQFTDADRLEIDRLEESLSRNEKLGEQARINSKDNFRFPFTEAFNESILNLMDTNPMLFKELVNKEGMKDLLLMYLLNKLYNKFNSKLEET